MSKSLVSLSINGSPCGCAIESGNESFVRSAVTRFELKCRRKFRPEDVAEGVDRIVYVPPVSILNAVDFDLLGEAEVCRLNTEEHLMKWSALYRASLLQDSMHVGEFPHDDHELVLRLGILKHRQRRKRWKGS